MAFIEDNNENSFVLKMVWLKENQPKFDVFKRGSRKTAERSVRWIIWKYLWISTKEFEYIKNWQTKKWLSVNIHLEDDWVSYVVQGWFNWLFRTALNCLIGVEKWEKISISIYQGKNDFPWISLWRWEEMIKREIDWETQKGMIKEVEFKGDKIKDYSKLENYILDKSLKYKKEEIQTEESFDFMDEKKEENKEEKTPASTNDDDLPF